MDYCVKKMFFKSGFCNRGCLKSLAVIADLFRDPGFRRFRHKAGMTFQT